MLDVLDPDIVKLDMTMIQNSPERDRATTLTGVLAHHERTGALIITEGVETDEHLEQALAVGAGFAQGFRFGHAAPLNRHQCAEGLPRLVHPARRGSAHTAAAESRKALRVARKEVIAAFSHHIEEQARHAVDHPMVLAAVQRADDFSESSRYLYQELAKISPLVAVFGRDVSADSVAASVASLSDLTTRCATSWRWSPSARTPAGPSSRARSPTPPITSASDASSS